MTQRGVQLQPMEAAEGATRVLAEWVCRLSYDTLPAEVVDRATDAIRDAVGVGLYGSLTPWSRIVAEYVADIGGKGRSTVWGTGLSTAPALAAMANGSFVQAVELDDRSHTDDVHNGCATVPAVLVLAEHVGATGRDVLVATVAGYELGFRVAKATRQGTRAWASIRNIMGAAAAAGKMLGLDVARQMNAFGIAGSMASGLREIIEAPDGVVPMVKRLQGGGWPSHCGVTAALLAKKGLTAPATVLEGKRGLVNTFCVDRAPDLSQLTSGLGEGYQMLSWETKLYAAWGSTHSTIEGLRQLRRELAFEPHQIRRIRIGCSSKTYAQAGAALPETLISAMYHVPFVAAVSLYRDLTDPGAWTEDLVRDARIRDTASRIHAVVEEEIDRGFKASNDNGRVHLIVELEDGRTGELDVPAARGRPSNPLSQNELKAKFRGLGSHVVEPEALAALEDWIEGLRHNSSAVNLSVLTAPAAASR